METPQDPLSVSFVFFAPTSRLQLPILYDIHPLATPLSRVTVTCGGAVSWWRLLAANMSTHDRNQRTSRSASRHRLSLSNQSQNGKRLLRFTSSNRNEVQFSGGGPPLYAASGARFRIPKASAGISLPPASRFEHPASRTVLDTPSYTK
jgi:hypothetical protein